MNRRARAEEASGRDNKANTGDRIEVELWEGGRAKRRDVTAGAV